MNCDKMYEEFQKTQAQMMESWQRWIFATTSHSEREEREAAFVLWKEILFPEDSLEEDETDRLTHLWKELQNYTHSPEVKESMEELWTQAILNVEKTQLMNMVSGSLQTLLKKIFSDVNFSDESWDSQVDYLREHIQFRDFGVRWMKNYRRQVNLNLFPNSTTEKMYLELQREYVELLMNYEEKILTYLFILGDFIHSQSEENWDQLLDEEDASFEAFIENWSMLVDDKLSQFHSQEEVDQLIQEIRGISDRLIQTQTLLMESKTGYLPFVNKRSYDELKGRVEELEEAVEHAVVRKDLESILGEINMVKKNLRKNASDTVYIETKLQKFVPRDEVDSILSQKGSNEELQTAQHIFREDLALTQRSLSQAEKALEGIREELKSLQELIKELQEMRSNNSK